MPKGNPAGYLPSVKRARAAVKRAGANPYKPRSKRPKARAGGPLPVGGSARSARPLLGHAQAQMKASHASARAELQAARLRDLRKLRKR